MLRDAVIQESEPIHGRNKHLFPEQREVPFLFNDGDGGSDCDCGAYTFADFPDRSRKGADDDGSRRYRIPLISRLPNGDRRTTSRLSRRFLVERAKGEHPEKIKRVGHINLHTHTHTYICFRTLVTVASSTFTTTCLTNPSAVTLFKPNRVATEKATTCRESRSNEHKTR